MHGTIPKKTAKKLENNFKVLCLFCAQKAETNTILGITSFLMSLGFLFGTGVNQNYELIYQVLPELSWALLFASYASVKIASCLTTLSSGLKYINSLIGLWAWSMIFLSFTVFDSTPTSPVEVILLSPIIIEVWVLLSIFDFTSAKETAKETPVKSLPKNKHRPLWLKGPDDR